MADSMDSTVNSYMDFGGILTNQTTLAAAGGIATGLLLPQMRVMGVNMVPPIGGFVAAKMQRNGIDPNLWMADRMGWDSVFCSMAVGHFAARLSMNIL